MIAEIHLIPDKTAVAQFFIFIIVLMGLSFFVFRPLKKLIRLRREQTLKLLEEAKKIEVEAANISSQYEQKLKEVRQLAHKEKEEIRNAGVEEASLIISKARKESSLVIEEGRAKIYAAKGAAMESLKKEVPVLVEEIVKKVKG